MSAAEQTPPVSSASAWWTMGVLALAYTASMIDRQLPSLFIQPIRRDLHISDTGVSLLTGFAFALFYTAAGVPIARQADRGSRKRVMILGLLLWGATTMFSGVTSIFWLFFIARMGVGLGEATLTPNAYAMTSELFPPHRQARATAVFTLGSAAGSGLGLVIGGVAIEIVRRVGALHVPGLGALSEWGTVFVALGALTIALILPMLTISEAPRAPKGAALQAGMIAVVGSLWRARQRYAALFLGVPLVSMMSYGLAAWAPTFFIRRFGWSEGEAGLKVGLASLAVGVAGTIAGAWISDRLRAAGRKDAPLVVMQWGYLLAAPLLAAFAFLPSANATLAFFAIAFLLVTPMGVLAPSALQAVTPDGSRAQTAAIYLLVVNIFGLGVGPTSVALLTDHLFRNDAAVGLSMAIVGALSLVVSAFLIRVGRAGFRDAS